MAATTPSIRPCRGTSMRCSAALPRKSSSQ
jgi:hypothetical protein